jgi:hypothetical protein
MFAFPSKLLPMGFLLAAPLLAACTAATGADPSASSDQSIDAAGKFVPNGIDTTVTLHAEPASKCAVYTDGVDGRIHQFDAETDATGGIDVSVAVQDETPFLVILDCVAPGHTHETYSYQVKASAQATQIDRVEAK